MCERGLNDNFNRLLRRYIPKGTDLQKITDENVRRVKGSLNLKPMKYFDFRQSAVVFRECLKIA